ncbi:MAG: hypothetical protein NZL95_07825 [Chitinophagales bacterium]|nr:hypothetical protein [Chitinophagales bacterium]MDW8428445.1 hypothetical protein [Chitinophagales bacterium]
MKPVLTPQFAVILLFLIAVACRDENPPPPAHPSEVITTVQLKFSSVDDPSEEFWVVFSDPDGIGGNPPVRFDSIRLKSTKTYECEITLIDESHTPAHDLTHEIEQEADDHQFYFLPSGVDVVVTYADADSKGRPIGLKSLWQCGAAGQGTMTLILKHKPGLKGDSDPPTVGDTDIEVAFTMFVVN